MKKHKSRKSVRKTPSSSQPSPSGEAQVFVLPPNLLEQLGINLSSINSSEVQLPDITSGEATENSETSSIIETANLMKESVLMSPTFHEIPSNSVTDVPIEQVIKETSVNTSVTIPMVIDNMPHTNNVEVNNIPISDPTIAELDDKNEFNSNSEIQQIPKVHSQETIKEYQAGNQDGNLVLSDACNGDYSRNTQIGIDDRKKNNPVDEHPDEAYLSDCSNSNSGSSFGNYNSELSKQKTSNKIQILSQEVIMDPAQLKNLRKICSNNNKLIPVTVNAVITGKSGQDGPCDTVTYAQTELISKQDNSSESIIPFVNSSVSLTNTMILEKVPDCILSSKTSSLMLSESGNKINADMNNDLDETKPKRSLEHNTLDNLTLAPCEGDSAVSTFDTKTMSIAEDSNKINYSTGNETGIVTDENMKRPKSDTTVNETTEKKHNHSAMIIEQNAPEITNNQCGDDSAMINKENVSQKRNQHNRIENNELSQSDRSDGPKSTNKLKSPESKDISYQIKYNDVLNDRNISETTKEYGDHDLMNNEENMADKIITQDNPIENNESSQCDQNNASTSTNQLKSPELIDISQDKVQEIAKYLNQIANERKFLKNKKLLDKNKKCKAKINNTIQSKLCVHGVEKPGGEEKHKENTTNTKFFKTYQRTNIRKQIAIPIPVLAKGETNDSFQLSESSDKEIQGIVKETVTSKEEFCICYDFGSLAYYDCEMLYEHVHFWQHKKIYYDAEMLYSIYNDECDNVSKKTIDIVEDDLQNECDINEAATDSICWSNILLESYDEGEESGFSASMLEFGLSSMNDIDVMTTPEKSLFTSNCPVKKEQSEDEDPEMEQNLISWNVDQKIDANAYVTLAVSGSGNENSTSSNIGVASASALKPSNVVIKANSTPMCGDVDVPPRYTRRTSKNDIVHSKSANEKSNTPLTPNKPLSEINDSARTVKSKNKALDIPETPLGPSETDIDVNLKPKPVDDVNSKSSRRSKHAEGIASKSSKRNTKTEAKYRKSNISTDATNASLGNNKSPNKTTDSEVLVKSAVFSNKGELPISLTNADTDISEKSIKSSSKNEVLAPSRATRTSSNIKFDDIADLKCSSNAESKMPLTSINSIDKYNSAKSAKNTSSIAMKIQYEDQDSTNSMKNSLRLSRKSGSTDNSECSKSSRCSTNIIIGDSIKESKDKNKSSNKTEPAESGVLAKSMKNSNKEDLSKVIPNADYDITKKSIKSPTKKEILETSRAARKSPNIKKDDSLKPKCSLNAENEVSLTSTNAVIKDSSAKSVKRTSSIAMKIQYEDEGSSNSITDSSRLSLTSGCTDISKISRRSSNIKIDDSTKVTLVTNKSEGSVKSTRKSDKVRLPKGFTNTDTPKKTITSHTKKEMLESSGVTKKSLNIKTEDATNPKYSSSTDIEPSTIVIEIDSPSSPAKRRSSIAMKIQYEEENTSNSVNDSPISEIDRALRSTNKSGSSEMSELARAKKRSSTMKDYFSVSMKRSKNTKNTSSNVSIANAERYTSEVPTSKSNTSITSLPGPSTADTSSFTEAQNIDLLACGVCKQDIDELQWIEHISNEHNYLAWRAKDPALDLENEEAVHKHLNTIINNHGRLVCPKCNCKRKKAKAYLVHIKKCKGININGDIFTNSVELNTTQANANNDDDQPLATIRSSKKRSRAQIKLDQKPDGMATCGVCNESLNETLWVDHIRTQHSYLAWKEGETPLNVEDEDAVISHLRNISRNNDGLICKKCGSSYKYVKKFLVHEKICHGKPRYASLECQRKSLLEVEIRPTVKCGVCKIDVEGKDWIMHIRQEHRYMAWVDGDTPIDEEDKDKVKEHLFKVLKSAGELICIKCGVSRKYPKSYLQHVKACEQIEFKIEVIKPSTTKEDEYECGVCQATGKKQHWRQHAMNNHYNVAWMVGELPINLRNFYAVEKFLKEYNLKHSLVCNTCGASRASCYGFYAHVLQCGKTAHELEAIQNTCDICNNKYLCIYRNQHMAVHRDQEYKKEKRKRDEEKAIELENKILLSDQAPMTKRRAAEKAKRVIEKYSSNVVDGKHVCACGATFDTAEEMSQHNCIQRDNANQSDSDVSIKIEDVSEESDGGTDIDSNVSEEVEEFTEREKRIRTYEATTKIIRMPYRVDNYKTYLMKSFRDFYNLHYARESLFTQWRDCKYEAVPEDEIPTYLPPLTESCNVRVGTGEWMTYKRFEAVKAFGYSLFTGACIQCMSWAPHNTDESSNNYLLVSCHRDADIPRYSADETPHYPGLLQLWDFGNFKSLPKFVSGIAHDYGIVWSMDWCPSGARDSLPKCNEDTRKPNLRLGLLAIACSNGTAYILPVPYPPQTEKELNIYKLKPVAELRLSTSSERRTYQATSISWSQQKGHEIIIVGYSDGTTALYDLNTESPFLKTTENDVTILYPFQDRLAENSAITGLGMYATANTSHAVGCLSSSSVTGSSVSGGAAAPSARCHLAMSALTPAPHWPSFMMSGDAGFTLNAINEIEWWGGGRRLGGSRAAAACWRCGRSAVAAAPALRLHRGHPCYPELKKEIIATLFMKPVGLKGKRKKVNDDLSMVVEPLTYDDAIDVYGLHFSLVSKKDQSTATKLCTENEECPERYPLGDINTVAFCPSVRYHDRLALATHAGIVFVITTTV